MTLVVGIHSSNPALTLREIAGQFKRLHERTTRGGTKWAPSSVKNLLDRARRIGLLDAKIIAQTKNDCKTRTLYTSVRPARNQNTASKP